VFGGCGVLQDQVHEQPEPRLREADHLIVVASGPLWWPGSKRGRTSSCGTGCANWASTSCPRPSCWPDRAVEDGDNMTGPRPAARGKSDRSTTSSATRTGSCCTLCSWRASTHDGKLFERALETNPAVRGCRDRPRCRPDKLHSDEGYDYRRCRAYLHIRGIRGDDRAAQDRKLLRSAASSNTLSLVC
jgi:hypothetical protein